MEGEGGREREGRKGEGEEESGQRWSEGSKWRKVCFD